MYLSLPKEQSNTNLPLDRLNFLVNIHLNSNRYLSNSFENASYFWKDSSCLENKRGGNKPIALPFAYARHATNCEILELERKKKKGREKKKIYIHERVVTSKNFKFGKCLIAWHLQTLSISKRVIANIEIDSPPLIDFSGSRFMIYASRPFISPRPASPTLVNSWPILNDYDRMVRRTRDREERQIQEIASVISSFIRKMKPCKCMYVYVSITFMSY